MTARRPAKPKDAKTAASRKTQAAKTKVAKSKADSAAKTAESAGAKGPRLSGAKAALRNSMVLAQHAAGIPWTQIAQQAEVSVRTCQRIVEQAQGLPAPTSEKPLKLIEDLTRELRASVGSYEAMAFDYADKNHSAALGAKKAADETRMRLIAVLADIGKLPRDLERFRSELELERVGEDLLDIMEKVAAGELDASAARDWIESLLRPAAVDSFVEAREVPELTEGEDG